MNYTNRLILTAPQSGDFASFCEIYSDPQTNLFNPHGPLSPEKAATAFADIQGHWITHGFGIWAIRPKGLENIIGFGGLSYRLYGNTVTLNLGYRFDKTAWGNGYATELAGFSIRYGFDELGFEKIYALVRPDHRASINVLEKCHMKICGTLADVPGQESSLVYGISKQGNLQ